MADSKWSRRKSIARAKQKAASQKERIHLWKRYFKNLLGKPPKVMNEPIKEIISNQLEVYAKRTQLGTKIN